MRLLHPPPQKSGFFGLPRTVRLVLYLALLALLLPTWMRLLEWKMTHHPIGYDGGAEWILPAQSEEVWLTTADNVKLHGWFLHAQQQPVRGTVLYSHGNGGNLTYVKGTAESLAKRGLDVLIYDYRGYGRSEGWRPNEMELYADGDAAYEYLTKTRSVSPEQLVIYGLSLGTTVATDLASRRACRALLLEAPLSSASDMATATLPILPPQLHWILKNRFESARKISNVKCPVFISHGDEDEVIPVEQGRKVFAAANEPKKLMIVPHGTHWLLNEKGYFDEVVNFILANLTTKQ